MKLAKGPGMLNSFQLYMKGKIVEDNTISQKWRNYIKGSTSFKSRAAIKVSDWICLYSSYLTCLLWSNITHPKIESAIWQSGLTSVGKMITAYLNQSSVEDCLKILLLPVMNERNITMKEKGRESVMRRMMRTKTSSKNCHPNGNDGPCSRETFRKSRPA